MAQLTLNQKIDLALLGCGIIVEDAPDPDDDQDKDSTRFIRPGVDRTAMKSAMKNSGHSVTSLASACDVEASMISRLLREPRRNDPDESARNPSITLAARIATELDTNAESLFPDIFDASRARDKLHVKRTRQRAHKPKKHLQRRGEPEPNTSGN